MDYEPDPESLEILGQQIRSALALYHQARDGYLMMVPGPGDGPPVARRIRKDVDLGPGRANPYIGAPPPLWASLPTRLPKESPANWIRRCGVAAVEAALSVLATDEEWRVDNLPGGGWRVTTPEASYDIRPGEVIR